MTLWGCSSMKISESKMDANGTQLFQPWKWCCTVEWSTIIKTIGIVKKSSNKQFLSLVWVGMADIIVNNESSVILNCHMLIVECYGHKDVEYGVKYNLILVSQTIFIDKYSCPSCILRTLLKNHPFLTNVIVFGNFENIYLEQCSPCSI